MDYLRSSNMLGIIGIVIIGASLGYIVEKLGENNKYM